MQFLLRLTYCLVLLITVLAGHSVGQLYHELRIADGDSDIQYFGATTGGDWLVAVTYDDLYVWKGSDGSLANQIEYDAEQFAINSAQGHLLLRHDDRDREGLDRYEIATGKITTTDISWKLNPLKFSADGNRLVCRHNDDGYQVFQYPEMNPLLSTRLKLENRQDLVSLSDDGKLIAFADDGVVDIWDVDTGKRISKSGKHIRSIDTIAFSPDGTKLAVGGELLGREGFAVFHTKTLLPVKRSVFECSSATDVTWFRDGKTLALIDYSKRCILIDPLSYQEKASFLAVGQRKVRALADGKLLVTTGYDHAISVWDWQASRRLRKPRLVHATHPEVSDEDDSSYNRGLHVCWSPDGTRLALAHLPDSSVFQATGRAGSIAGGVVRSTADNLRDGTERQSGKEKPRPQKSSTSRVVMLDPKTGRETAVLPTASIPNLGKSKVDKIAFFPDGERLACLIRDAYAFVAWNPKNNQVGMLTGNSSSTWPNPFNFAFLPSGDSIAFVASGKLLIHDIKANRIAKTVEGRFATSIKFLNENEFLSGQAFWKLDVGKVQFQSKSGGKTHFIEAYGEHTYALNYRSQSIYQWNLETLETPTPFQIESPALSYSLSEGGQLLAAGCVDGLIRVWSTASGRLLTNLQGHSRSVESVDFAPQGLILASVGRDGQTMIWDLRDLKDGSAALRKPSLPTHQTFRTASGASVSVSFDRPATDAEVTAALQEALKEVSEKN